jgi:hypothetical protein
MSEILAADRNAQVEYAHDCYDGWTAAKVDQMRDADGLLLDADHGSLRRLAV